MYIILHIHASCVIGGDENDKPIKRKKMKKKKGSTTTTTMAGHDPHALLYRRLSRKKSVEGTKANILPKARYGEKRRLLLLPWDHQKGIWENAN